MKIVINLIPLVVGLVAMIYGIKNIDDPCSNSQDLPDLGIWMVVHGSLMIFFSLITGICLFFGDTGKALYVCGQLLYSMFNTIWSIIGGIILWRDSLDCMEQNRTLYDSAMAVIIISYILIYCSAWVTQKTAGEREKEGA